MRYKRHAAIDIETTLDNNCRDSATPTPTMHWWRSRQTRTGIISVSRWWHVRQPVDTHAPYYDKGTPKGQLHFFKQFFFSKTISSLFFPAATRAQDNIVDAFNWMCAWNFHCTSSSVQERNTWHRYRPSMGLWVLAVDIGFENTSVAWHFDKKKKERKFPAATAIRRWMQRSASFFLWGSKHAFDGFSAPKILHLTFNWMGIRYRTRLSGGWSSIDALLSFRIPMLGRTNEQFPGEKKKLEIVLGVEWTSGTVPTTFLFCSDKI